MLDRHGKKHTINTQKLTDDQWACLDRVLIELSRCCIWQANLILSTNEAGRILHRHLPLFTQRCRAVKLLVFDLQQMALPWVSAREYEQYSSDVTDKNHHANVLARTFAESPAITIFSIPTRSDEEGYGVCDLGEKRDFQVPRVTQKLYMVRIRCALNLLG